MFKNIVIALFANILLADAHRLNPPIHVDEDGWTTTGTAIGLRYQDSFFEFNSLDYPKPSIPYLKQSWRFVSSSILGEDAPQALEIKCNDIRLYKTEPCDEYIFEIEDGDKHTKFCGSDFDYKYISETKDITILLSVGKYGNGLLNCSARMLNLDENGYEITTTTTTEQPSTEPSWTQQEIIQVDSREHGLGGGNTETSCKCGYTNKMQHTRIVGGRETLIHEYPWAVQIIETNMKEEQKWPFCGGSIITERHVLTAAHCLILGSGENVFYGVVVGEHDFTKDDDTKEVRVHRVSQIFAHEKYSYNRLRYDIALMVVARPIQFNDYVGPVCLPIKNFDLTNDYVKAIGWGVTENKEQSPYLKTVHLKVVDIDSCYNYHPWYIEKENVHQICTFAWHESTCMGDSGGPVVRINNSTNRYDLIGVVSFGRICGRKGLTGHTKVPALLTWIQEKIKDSQYHINTCHALS